METSSPHAQAVRNTALHGKAGKGMAFHQRPEEFQRLLRLLQRAEGLALAFVQCNLWAQREDLEQTLGAALAKVGRRARALHLDAPTDSLYNEIRERLPDLKAGDVLFVSGFEKAIPAEEKYPPGLTVLNMQRELFRNIPCPVVLFLPEYALTKLAREAQDFWAWRSGVFEVAVEKEAFGVAIHALTSHEGWQIASLSLERKQRYLEVLKELLAKQEAEGGRNEEEGKLCCRIAYLLWTLGQWHEAQQYVDKGLDRAHKAKSPYLTAQMLHILGLLKQVQGDYETARARYSEDLEIRKKLGDSRGIANTLHNLGIIAQDQGNITEAERLYRESMKLKEELGDKRGIASTLHQLGMLAQDQGDYAEVVRFYRERIKLAEELGNKSGIASTLHQLGMLAQDQGDYVKAERLYRESMKTFEGLGAKSEQANTLEQLGQVACAQGQLKEALGYFLRAFAIFEELHSPYRERVQKEIASIQGEVGMRHSEGS